MAGCSGAHVQRSIDAVNALERLLMGADSPGIRLAAGLGLELLLKKGLPGRALHAGTRLPIGFAVSVTILSGDLEHVLIKKKSRSKLLPRRVVNLSERERFEHLALKLAVSIIKDQSAEVVLGGRALSVEFWDDVGDEVIIGLNYLVIARGSLESNDDSDWGFVPFSGVKIDGLDPREALALSEMLTIMGIENPYEMSSQAMSHFSAA